MKAKDIVRVLALFAAASVISVLWQFAKGWDWADFIGRSAVVLLVCIVSFMLAKRRRGSNT